MTWPVAAGLTRDVPSDLGDPAFVTAMLAWGSEHWLSLARGDLAAAARFWDAPFFHPEPLATAYSEHFALHALLTLPVFAATRNAILCYNLWFLATFVLSGVGMYLLVRDLTGRPAAAFVAGLAFAFAPYRVATLPHLQVLSSHWMPFVLFGFRRYFESGRTDALLGAGGALWAQNLSSGYYMVFFGPFVLLYVAVEIWARSLMRQARVWRDVSVTLVVASIATLPFAMPYLIRQRGTRRSLNEVMYFSADLKGWLTASPLMNVWGGLQTFVKAEGLLFPGLTVVTLAAAGIWLSWRASRAPAPEARRARVVALFGSAALVSSFWLALGPEVQIETQPTGFPALYGLAYHYLPGFNVARVPARFAMVTVLSLALLSGFALAAFDAPRRRWVLVVAALLLLAEGSAFPLPRNGTWSSAPGELAAAHGRLYPEPHLPPLYRYLQSLDAAVIAHFPFGLPEREIQYVYYAAIHRQRIVNGYSGVFPASYNLRLPFFRQPLVERESTLTLLDADAVTHVVVDAGAWLDDTGLRIRDMLVDAGWRQAARFDEAYVLVRAPVQANGHPRR
jgi:hypothetical protein